MTAEEFLLKLRDNEKWGAIVCSGDCSAMEISDAQATNRFYVDNQGFGYVLRTREWLETRENAFGYVSEGR